MILHLLSPPPFYHGAPGGARDGDGHRAGQRVSGKVWASRVRGDKEERG